MILPAKGLSERRALLTVGSEVLVVLSAEQSVNSTWSATKVRWDRLPGQERLTFDWFVLALSMLYACEMIEMTAEGLLRRRNVSSSP